ncbi:TetR/AcrR family transcriptional regulator [Nonomuraea lactucae]|uniref:TetR/AcrR family transcriptional regulator n=1 Tax=Nonomuraea lactucae TaxID=2249762 RepID=UPI000DE23252|nr:TetR family transcriptional regulator [Nonomuraea lactucae]
MPYDSAATRARILNAAINEFTVYGLSGARIERIAEAADANKRSIYVYFGDKEGLFTAALHRVITELIEAVPLTEDDLPGYAGRMFDYMVGQPQALRMHLWRHLQRPSAGPDAAEVYAQKIEAMTRGGPSEATGNLPATDLLVLVIGLAQSWLISPVDLLTAAGGGDPYSPERLAAHRAAIVEAARRLCTPR